MKKKRKTPSGNKVRRIFTGGKSAGGGRRRRRIRRPDPAAIRMGGPDDNLSAFAGLLGFAVYTRRVGVDEELYQLSGRLKQGRGVVYPMGGQLRLLVDSFVAGQTRVFGVEGLASDPLFLHLAGGAVPSIDVLYDDLRRFDEQALTDLEALMATQGLAQIHALRGPYVHLDIDTTVTPLFGNHEGAVPGPNPRYHGRPSFHPILARIAETGRIVGAQLRPGDTNLGADDVPMIRRIVARARNALRRNVSLCIRIDAGGDCVEILQALHSAQVFYTIKAKITPNLFCAVALHSEWRTTDADADGRPTRQVAEIDFARPAWQAAGLPVRVIAVRSLERHGKQLALIEEADWTFQAFLTNRIDEPDEIAWDYDPRAGIEPVIADLKGFWGIGHASSESFEANHAVLLLKLLTYNLLLRYAEQRYPSLPRWRTAWYRRTLIVVPGRISHSGRVLRLHVPSGSSLNAPRLE